MKKVAILVTSILLLTSCATPNYYQVYDVETVGLKDQGDVLVYENEDVIISYSLWGESGNLSFVFQNKLNENLYLIMPQCFLIHNGWALDYYDDNTYSYTATNTTTAAVSAQASLYGFTQHYNHWHPASISRGAAIASSSSNSNTVTYKAPTTICIPDHSSKVVEGFNITKTVHLECDKTKSNFPKYSSLYLQFEQSNSPLTINNVLTYSTNAEGKNAKIVENMFWVKSITNYSEKGAFDQYTQKDCVTGLPTTVKTFKMAQPNRFYNIYNKQTSRGTIIDSPKDKTSKKGLKNLFSKSASKDDIY